MVAIKGGKFVMGSPASEAGRKDDEGPQHEVKIAPFWMGKYEVTWDEYELFMFTSTSAATKTARSEKLDAALDKLADAVTPADQAVHRHDASAWARTAFRPSA